MMGDATRGEGAAAEPSRRAEEPLRRQVSILAQCASARSCESVCFEAILSLPNLEIPLPRRRDLWGKRMQAASCGESACMRRKGERGGMGFCEEVRHGKLGC